MSVGNIDTPTIVTDGAVRHYFNDVDVNLDGLSSFYSQLPHPDKPSLANCVIYLSSLGYVAERRLIGGITSHNNDANEIDHLSPEATDVVVFLGSLLMYNQTDIAKNEVDRPSEVLAHELTHYAQQLTLLDLLVRRDRLMAHANLVTTPWFMRGRRQKYANQLAKLDHQLDHEQDAREHEHGMTDLLVLNEKPANERPPVMVFHDDKYMHNRWMRRKHEKAALSGAFPLSIWD